MKPRLGLCILELLRIERVPYEELNRWEPGSCLQAIKDINESSPMRLFSPRYPHRGTPAALEIRILECKVRCPSNIALALEYLAFLNTTPLQ